MRHRFLPSGRVRYLALSEADASGRVVSLLNGDRVDVDARCVVDGTYSQMQIPSTHSPSYDVVEEATCVPVNALPRRAAEFDEYVVIGAGKTGMDACCWLLEHGVDRGARPVPRSPPSGRRQRAAAPRTRDGRRDAPRSGGSRNELTAARAVERWTRTSSTPCGMFTLSGHANVSGGA